MALESSPMLQMATHALSWLAVICCVIRCVALAASYVMVVVVALFHRVPQRRRDAREVLASHPFTRRR